jgi:hypothetical protein
MFELEKLQENRLITQDLVAYNWWNSSLWSQNWFIETMFQFGNYVLWFPSVISRHVPKFRDDGLDHIESNLVCPIILFYLSPPICLILT